MLWPNLHNAGHVLILPYAKVILSGKPQPDQAPSDASMSQLWNKNRIAQAQFTVCPSTLGRRNAQTHTCDIPVLITQVREMKEPSEGGVLHDYTIPNWQHPASRWESVSALA